MLDPVMSLVCRVATITNERWSTIYKQWPLHRVHQAEVEWWLSKGYSCQPITGSTSQRYITNIPG